MFWKTDEAAQSLDKDMGFWRNNYLSTCGLNFIAGIKEITAE